MNDSEYRSWLNGMGIEMSKFPIKYFIIRSLKVILASNCQFGLTEEKTADALFTTSMFLMDLVGRKTNYFIDLVKAF